MRKLYAIRLVGLLALFGLSYWKNTYSYSFKPLKWRLVKSLADASLVALAAIFLPALLVGWIVMWLTRGINRRGVQVTIAVILGVFLGSIGGVVLEALCVLATFAVDLVTGNRGVYGWWVKGPPSSFMPSFSEEKPC